MILVLGSGFGLYGHVAALALEGAPVATLAHYRPIAEARAELAPLCTRIEWLADEEAALARARLTCLARRPADNAALAAHLISETMGGALVIEKPIAPTWQAAQVLERTLVARARRWAVPFLFLYSDWFEMLSDSLARGRAVRIRWAHRQSPSARTWKRVETEGGGALAFYFTHCLAVIEAALPGAKILATRYRRADGTEHINAQATAGGPTLAIDFTLGDRLSFEVGSDGGAVFAAATPFGAPPAAGAPDPRIPALRRFYRALDPDGRGAPPPAFHAAVTRSWRDLAATSHG